MKRHFSVTLPSEQPTNPEPPAVWKRCVDDLTSEKTNALAAWRGYSQPFCETLKNWQIIGLFNDRIAFSIQDSQNRHVGCHYRPLGGEGTWAVSWFTNELHRLSPIRLNDPPSKDAVIMFESQWDMLAFLDKFVAADEQLPDFGFIATRGALNVRNAVAFCRPGATIIACQQNDEAGKKWLDGILKAANCEVAVVTIPQPHKDLNDWTRTGALRADLEVAFSNAIVLKQGPSEPDEDWFPGRDHYGSSGPDQIIEQPYKGSTQPEKLEDGRMLIRRPGDNRLLSDFAAEMGAALANTELFNRNGLPFVIDHITKSLKLMTPESFRTWLERHVVCYRIEYQDSGRPVRVRRTLSVTDAAAVLASQQFLGQLRRVRRLNQVRLPIIRNSGAIEILPAGFDEPSGTFTFDTVAVDYTTIQTAEDAKAVLTSLFAEFCFPADQGRSLGVSISALMTLFGQGLLPPTAILPLFLVIANAEGAGKTVLVKAIVVSIFGSFAVSTKPNNEEEVRKMLLASVMEGRSVIVLDNLKEHLDSPSLEAFLTSAVWTDRILGSSKTFTAEKHTVVFATGNSSTVSPDMRRRSLFVELFMQEERPEARQFNQIMDVPFLLSIQPKVLSALWTLVKLWDTAGRPSGSRTHSSFVEWSRTIAAVVEHAGFASPVEAPANPFLADKDGADMRKLTQGLGPGSIRPEFDFQQIVELAQGVGAFEALVGANGPLDRKIKTIFSRILKRWDGRNVGDYQFSLVGQGHSRKYVFMKREPELIEASNINEW